MSASTDRSRALLLLIAVAVIGGAALLAYRSQTGERPDAPIIGMVRETELRVSPDVTGRLQSLRAVAGQSVKKGDVVAALSNPELEASVRGRKRRRIRRWPIATMSTRASERKSAISRARM